MNPYTLLGIPNNASQDDIRKAYRKIAKKYHPDLNPGNKNAEKKFKEYNIANDILSDPEKRAKFDRGEIDDTGSTQYQHLQGDGSEAAGSFNNRRNFYQETHNGGGQYSSSFQDFDSDMFEGIFRNRGSKFKNPEPQDENYKMEISFKDAALGAEKEINIPNNKNFKIKIPPGIESGNKLRFKGAVSSKGKAVGDIFIEIQVAPSKLFTRNVNNIEMVLPITIYEAVLGGEVSTPTLESPVMLKMPPGASTGTKLRLKGKGIGSKIPGGIRGDIIVTLKIVLPNEINPELQKIMKDWGSAHPYNPRVNIEN